MFCPRCDSNQSAEIKFCTSCGANNRVDESKLKLNLASKCGRCHQLLPAAGRPVTVTDATDSRLSRSLEALGATIVPGGCEPVGSAMRALLRAALATERSSYLYCDFDRWLHWCGTYPQELAEIPAR